MSMTKQGDPGRSHEATPSGDTSDTRQGAAGATQASGGLARAGASMGSHNGERAQAAGSTERGEGRARRVGDVMTPNPRTVTPDTPIEEAARLFAELHAGALPVVESEDNNIPVGMLTDRDIVTRVLAHGENPLDLDVSDCMTTPALCIGRDDDIEDAVCIFEQARVRRAIVIDDDGRCCGVVAQADLAYAVDDNLAAELVRAISRPTESEEHLPHGSSGSP